MFPSSACPTCHTEIKPYDNIPVLSWLILGGRCRSCKTPITPRYATVELIVAFLFLACYWSFGWSFSTLKYCIFCFLVTGLVFIDAEWKLLPDLLTLPGIVIGLIFSWIVPTDRLLADLLPMFFNVPLLNGGRLLSFCESLAGAIVGAAFIFGVGFIYLQARGVEGMGFGDVKLMAMVGAFLGVKLTVFTIFSASLLGTFFGLGLMLNVWMARTRRRMSRHRESNQLARRKAWHSAMLGLPALSDAVRRIPRWDGVVRPLLRQASAGMVLGAVFMRLLANPTLLQMFALFLLIAATMVIVLVLIRGMRKGITSEIAAVSAKPRTEAPDFAAATYQGVIAGLKQREQELVGQLFAETKRAESVESFKSTVLE